MDKLKLAQLGERLKTGGAQMGRMVSGKMKEILQTPTPESKMVDEATLETLEEPNWGMNLRICAMINSEEFSGSEIVRAIKKKISGKNVVSQRLGLDLLEACTSNCEKVFSEVASEKVLDEMVRMIDNPTTDHGNAERAMQLIRAWGESEDLAYLPVFRQTYMSLKGRNSLLEDRDSPPVHYNLESYVEQPLSPPGSYPIPEVGLHNVDRSATSFDLQIQSDEEKKEFLVITRNSLELLTSILNTETEPKPLKEDLTVSMLEKCKQSQPVIKRIIERTTDDEGLLFEALYLHDELQQVVSKYEKLEASQTSERQPLENSESTKYEGLRDAQEPQEKIPQNFDAHYKELEDAIKSDQKLPEKSAPFEASSPSQVATHDETKIVNSQNAESSNSSSENKNE
ncbi:hypothetical protein FEM48_Zijuj09G0057900 [Ziziphus jujuba var. spinosa]|uniref:TOM1-like protein 2 n=1 Tax=Ziziphus jujuba var. spinosa TaxID=714518 RepID=A0A978UR84_ZIZJJ|nr:hypothetical protein FEM48_Zijuj09G0057900 [Ziziphus jujuba var. spinosa]